MAQSSWMQYWSGWLFKTRAAGVAQTPEQYLQLTTQCMEEARMLTSPRDSKSTQVKFNHEQCKYLANKLVRAVHCAYWFLEHHFHNSLSASPEDTAKCLELSKILFMLAKEVECFIQGCFKEHWIQAAVNLTNVSDHVLSIGLDLELCTIFFSSLSHLGCLTLREVADVRNAEFKLVKEKAFIDDGTLSSNIKALIDSGKASSDDCELATFLLERLERLDRSRQQSPPLGKPESLQLSLYERSDVSSLKQMVKIGKGGFATVHRAIWLGAEVAVKTFHGPENPDFKKEVSICARVSHPNITSLLFFGVDNGECSIVMELMDEDLQSMMRTRLRCNRTLESPFCIFVALDLMLQVAEGMCYLHRMRIVHRDLKSHNILVRCVKSTEVEGHEYIQAKVADFGLSRTKERSMTYSNQTPNMGTTRWMAPEMMRRGSNTRQKRYPFKSDVYSFAMVCYEILTGKFPFSTTHHNAEVKRKVLTGDRPQLPNQCPDQLRTLIEKCWSLEAGTRPCFSDICLELRYLKSLHMSWSGTGTSAASTSAASNSVASASVSSVPSVAASLGGHVAVQSLPVETVKDVLVREVLMRTPENTSSAMSGPPPVNTEAELLPKTEAPVNMEAELLAKATAAALQKMGVFSTQDKQVSAQLSLQHVWKAEDHKVDTKLAGFKQELQELPFSGIMLFSSSSSFSQAPASSGLTPPIQVPTQTQNQVVQNQEISRIRDTVQAFNKYLAQRKNSRKR